MEPRDFDAEARERKEDVARVRITVLAAAGVVASVIVAYVTHLAEFPPAFYPNRQALLALLPLLGLAALTYLYVVRPHLDRIMEGHAPVAARSKLQWQHDMLTRAVHAHGLTPTFHQYILPDAAAYALVGIAGFQVVQGTTGLARAACIVIAAFAAWRAIVYGFSWLMPRKTFAGTHSYLRKEQDAMTRRLRNGERVPQANTANLPEPLWNGMVKLTLGWRRVRMFVYVPLFSYFAFQLYQNLPPATFSPNGLLAALAIGASILGVISFFKALAWTHGASSAKLLGELANAVRAGEMDRAEAEEVYRGIELFRANHIAIPGGLNAIRLVLRDASTPAAGLPFGVDKKLARESADARTIPISAPANQESADPPR